MKVINKIFIIIIFLFLSISLSTQAIDFGKEGKFYCEVQNSVGIQSEGQSSGKIIMDDAGLLINITKSSIKEEEKRDEHFCDFENTLQYGWLDSKPHRMSLCASNKEYFYKAEIRTDSVIIDPHYLYSVDGFKYYSRGHNGLQISTDGNFFIINDSGTSYYLINGTCEIFEE